MSARLCGGTPPRKAYGIVGGLHSKADDGIPGCGSPVSVIYVATIPGKSTVPTFVCPVCDSGSVTF